MSATPKDKALARGKAPRTIFVEFRRDSLNPGKDYFVGEVYFYKIDADADAIGPVFTYELKP